MGDEATALLPIPVVIVNRAVTMGVILAPADTDLAIHRSDLVVAEVVTIFCLCVATLAYSHGYFVVSIEPEVSVNEYDSYSAEDVV